MAAPNVARHEATRRGPGDANRRCQTCNTLLGSVQARKYHEVLPRLSHFQFRVQFFLLKSPAPQHPGHDPVVVFGTSSVHTLGGRAWACPRQDVISNQASGPHSSSPVSLGFFLVTPFFGHAHFKEVISMFAHNLAYSTDHIRGDPTRRNGGCRENQKTTEFRAPHRRH